MVGLWVPLVDGVLIVLLGEDGVIVLGEVDGLVFDWACAKPAMPRAAVNATAAVSVRFIGGSPKV
jgi:hypothetical protein